MLLRTAIPVLVTSLFESLNPCTEIRNQKTLFSLITQDNIGINSNKVALLNLRLLGPVPVCLRVGLQGLLM